MKGCRLFWKHNYQLFNAQRYSGNKYYVFVCSNCGNTQPISVKRFWTGEATRF